MRERYNEFTSEYGVAVPIIQRDYVQGADANFEKRDKFLESIFDALLTGSLLEIDFIYGSSDRKDDGSLFQPVDGQQRLTTLALIGWLLNQKVSMRYADKLKLLTYTTRPSTEQFCMGLFSYRLPEGYGTISDHIRKVPGWFSERWLLDPSVVAMLQLLDRADGMLQEKKYADKLDDMAEHFFEDNPVVFESMDLEELSLDDDLYIKMNARGKLLTEFENWKAEFEGFLKMRFPEACYEYGSVPNNHKKPTYLQYFEYAVEHEWCDVFWPIAYDRWKSLSNNERDRVGYPRVDELFMNIVDYVSGFLYFSALSDVEAEAKKKGLKEIRLLYDHERDRSRIEVYAKEENVVKLFRILDLLVDIRKKYGGFEPFFEHLFVSTDLPGRLRTFKVNLFDAPSVDLVMLCLDGKLQTVTEVELWAVFEWLLTHPACIDGNENHDAMLDFLRIIMGWARGKRQRLTYGLRVNTNLRLSDYYEAAQIIGTLSSAPNLFAALKATTYVSLAAERDKAALYGTERYDAVRELSTCPELYYSFNLLIPSLKDADDVPAYIDRFYEFVSMDDLKRIQALNAYGFEGVCPMYSHYFYGVRGKWDYIFTVPVSDRGYDKTVKAFTSWMKNEPKMSFTTDSMAYYVDRYPEFVQSRNNRQYQGEPCHYFIHGIGDDFRVWAVKTFSTQPIRGYNVDPYGYAVERLYHGRYALIAESDNSTHGLLRIGSGLTMECVADGWEISVQDKEHIAAENFMSRFCVGEGSPEDSGYVDAVGQFRFAGKILLDMDGHDRIQTALAFLEQF